MSYQVGDPVWIRTLKREGIVQEVPKPGQYRVAAGTMTVQCREPDLKDIPKKKKKKGGRTARKAAPTPSEDSAPATVDLHGLIVADAIQTMESAINRGILAGAASLQVMHGLGTGKVKSAVHAYLSKASFIKSFRIDPSNPGVTTVYF